MFVTNFAKCLFSRLKRSPFPTKSEPFALNLSHFRHQTIFFIRYGNPWSEADESNFFNPLSKALKFIKLLGWKWKY